MTPSQPALRLIQSGETLQDGTGSADALPAGTGSADALPGAPDSADALVESVKAALRSRRSSVAIVSTFSGRQPVGCVVSAFLSLSLQPPSLLVSLRSGSETLGHIQSSNRFGLSLLGDEHRALIEVFSHGRAGERFGATDYGVLHGVPLVDDAPAVFACTLTAQIPMYDHTLVVGEVLRADLPAARAVAEPRRAVHR
jgi:flavin reductase (DIM6/NTAB) family NADH-FMN oxidoreductase RutF